MHNYYHRRSVRSRSAPSGSRSVTKDTTPRASSYLKQNTEPLLFHGRVPSKVEQELPLRHHAGCIIQGIWRWFKSTSLPVRTVLILLVLYMLLGISVPLIQFVISSMTPMYTILGIIASGIIIYEFAARDHQKKS